MNHERYTLEYLGPKPQRKWIALSVSALAPFPPSEVAEYRRKIATAMTEYRGVAVLPAMVRMRLLVDGKVFMEYER